MADRMCNVDQICTSIEQSKKLLSLGLDPGTADMCWTKYIDNGDITSLHVTVNYGIVPIDYPCWSLTALLKLMPRIIPNEGILCITPSHKDSGWVVGYDEENASFPTLIDTAFEMVCQLIEQGHIKVNK